MGDGAGTTGADAGPGADGSRQQQFSPQEPHAQAFPSEAAATAPVHAAGRQGPPIKAAQNTSVASNFIRVSRPSSGRVYLAFGAFWAWASASSIFLRYLAGSFWNALRQPLQHSLISRLPCVKT